MPSISADQLHLTQILFSCCTGSQGSLSFLSARTPSALSCGCPCPINCCEAFSGGGLLSEDISALGKSKAQEPRDDAADGENNKDPEESKR